MDKLELSILIVDFKSQDFTLRLVSDLQKYLASLRYEIIIVDNDPDGNADKIFRKKFGGEKNIQIIKAEKNSGFGAGNNLAAASATGEYLLLLNPDTSVVDNSIEKMLDFLAKHSEVGALSPLVFQIDGETLQRHFFGRFQSLATLLLRNQAGIMPADPPDFFYVDMITSAAMMLRRELYEKLGGFDEKFFLYMEDEDLCRRISKLGLKNAVLTTAKIIHFEGKSSTSFEKKKFYYKSQDYYWRKHYGSFQTAMMKILRYPYIFLQKIK